MEPLDRTLVTLHFVGLVLGFSVSISSIVMSVLIARSDPPDRPVLARFLPMMSKVGTTGLALLWVTGVTLVYTKWHGWAELPWEFKVKIPAVVLLTVTVVYVHRLERLASKGDASATVRIQTAGKAATLFALTALVFAVLAVN